MKACPGYLAAVDFHCIKQGNRCNFPAASRLPFDGTEDGFIHIILKFEGNAVIVMVSGASQTLGISKTVKAEYHSVNRDV